MLHGVKGNTRGRSRPESGDTGCSKGRRKRGGRGAGPRVVRGSCAFFTLEPPVAVPVSGPEVGVGGTSGLDIPGEDGAGVRWRG